METLNWLDVFVPIINLILILCGTVAGIVLFIWQGRQFDKRQHDKELEFERRQEELLKRLKGDE